MKVLIDNGHGWETPGKRSPDGRLREYAWAREIAARVVNALKAKGIDAELVVPETTDVSLRERVKRVNAACKEYGSKNCLLVSIHNNAAGNGTEWRSARGWCGFIAPNASERSKVLAQTLYKYAEAAGLKGNRSVPSARYWVASLAMCRDTNCAAVLTENLFQDNKEDVEYLLSDEGKQTLTDVHVAAICEYIESVK